MKCNICNQETKQLFSAEIMKKHTILYYSCLSCNFIQTEKPFWLDEAYSSAISSIDVGYVTRNVVYAEIVSSVIKFFYNRKNKFIDYGGGYGMFTRLMRDNGYDYYRQDIYCENLFAEYFDINDFPKEKLKKFEVLTSFEVFEHLINPIKEIEKMFAFSESILFSTALQPDIEFKSIDDWWYFLPFSGQHVSLYSKKSLVAISKKFNCNLYTNNRDFHLLTKKKYIINPVFIIYYAYKIRDKIMGKNFLNKKSLIKKDFELIKNS
tara:strand:- start:1015 stop:1809 length:795 start_codon:yes stop_codon:yes gene_type:complete